MLRYLHLAIETALLSAGEVSRKSVLSYVTEATRFSVKRQDTIQVSSVDTP